MAASVSGPSSKVGTMSNTTETAMAARLCREGIDIGATCGLAIPSGDVRPEQLHVIRVADPARPVAIEGWNGYSIPQRMHVTARQAAELIGLLAQALVTETP